MIVLVLTVLAACGNYNEPEEPLLVLPNCSPEDLELPALIFEPGEMIEIETEEGSYLFTVAGAEILPPLERAELGVYAISWVYENIGVLELFEERLIIRDSFGNRVWLFEVCECESEPLEPGETQTSSDWFAI